VAVPRPAADPDVAAGPDAGRDGEAGPARRQAAREQLRQRAVERMMILDTPPEERFDRLTRLAQKVFGVPVAAITLLDHGRVWCKSCAGMRAEDTPRTESFCDSAVAQEETLVVEDARLDPRFAGLPAVREEPGIRFYAGHPIADADGIVVGTFCLVGSEPRTLNARDRELLAELSAWARQELIGSADTRRAREVQQSLLPTRAPGFAGYDIAAICLPALTVGGDFYDYSVSGSALRFCVADVMGKGAGAAIITATVRAAMRAAWSPGVRDRRQEARWTAGEVLSHANRTLQRDLEETGSLVTVLAASIDGPSGRAQYADAGHGLTVVAGDSGSVRWLESSGLPFGVDAGMVFSDQQIELRPGDTLLCFSDGLLDLYGGDGAGLDEIARLVRERPDPRELTGYIRQLAAGAVPGDDVTALAVRRQPAT
jgi:serine phosphatase RsbU (regulator of sigma subunit)